MYRLAIVFWCAVALTSLQFSQADDCNSTDTGADTGTETGRSIASRTLCMEFQVLRDVIPNATLASLTAVYYQNSLRFRHAMLYMQSDEFMNITAQLEATDAYQQMLQDLENAGVDTTDLSSIIGILDCVLLPVPISNAIAVSPAKDVKLRTLTTYALQLMRAIPRDQFVQVLKENLVGNKQFRLFYKVVRSQTFEREMLSALRSRDAAPALSVLRRNFIDLGKLIAIAYRILSWGPPI